MLILIGLLGLMISGIYFFRQEKGEDIGGACIVLSGIGFTIYAIYWLLVYSIKVN